MSEPTPVDLLVEHGYLITMDPRRTIEPDGAVAVAGSRIAAVGPTAQVKAAVRPARVIDARGAPVHPGFVECHTHSTFHLVRGAFGDVCSYEEFAAAQLPYINVVEDEDELASALLASLEMIHNGTTCFMDAGTAFEPDAVAEAANRTGIRALVGDTFIADLGPDGVPESGASANMRRAPAAPGRAFALLGSQLRRNADPDALVRGHVALIGMGTASDELEKAGRELADAHGVVLQQHQSYRPVDTHFDDVRFGQHALVHLANLGVLNRRCTLTTLNVVRDDEVGPLLDSGTSVTWSPAASMLWGVGGNFHGRHAELHGLGVNVAFGSDSSNWANALDIGLQGYLALLSAREASGRRDILSADDVLAMSTINGARAVGLENEIGSLEIGKRADIVIRADDVPEAFPRSHPIGQIVYSALAKSVRTVLVNGRAVLEDRRAMFVDPEEVYALAERRTRSAFDRMGYTVRHNPLPIAWEKAGASDRSSQSGEHG